MSVAANPESGAESLSRIIGAGAAVLGLGTLYGLYLADTPINWLSNLGISVGDNSWRTLGIFGITAAAIGISLYTKKGLWIVILVGLLAFAYIGKKNNWYSIGHATSTQVSTPAVNNGTTNNRSALISTGAHLTQQQKAWCNITNSDGLINRNTSALAKANCSTGIVHREQ